MAPEMLLDRSAGERLSSCRARSNSCRKEWRLNEEGARAFVYRRGRPGHHGVCFVACVRRSRSDRGNQRVRPGDQYCFLEGCIGPYHQCGTNLIRGKTVFANGFCGSSIILSDKSGHEREQLRLRKSRIFSPMRPKQEWRIGSVVASEIPWTVRTPIIVYGQGAVLQW